MDYEAKKEELVVRHNKFLSETNALEAKAEEFKTACTEIRGQIALLDELQKEELTKEPEGEGKEDAPEGEKVEEGADV